MSLSDSSWSRLLLGLAHPLEFRGEAGAGQLPPQGLAMAEGIRPRGRTRKYTTGPTPGARTMKNSHANVDCGDRFSSTRKTDATARYSTYSTYSAHESSTGIAALQRVASAPATQGGRRALLIGACWVTLVVGLLGWLAVTRPATLSAQANAIAWAWSGAITHDGATVVARLAPVPPGPASW